MGMNQSLRRDDFRQRVERFFAGGSLAKGVSHPRSQSYDHCYNYFLDNHSNLARDMEKSCAALGFYLASWGMYRGSAYLFKNTNSAHFVPLIEYIENHADELRPIDLHVYDDANIGRVCRAYKEIGDLVLEGTGSARVTLVTKIMIAVFGRVPAFDSFFNRGMARVHAPFERNQRVAFHAFDELRLRRLSDFYLANQTEIDELSAESRTVGFPDGSVTGHRLTRAKIADMYAFNLGSPDENRQRIIA